MIIVLVAVVVWLRRWGYISVISLFPTSEVNLLIGLSNIVRIPFLFISN